MGEFYLQTQAGGLKRSNLSLLVDTARGIKNPGYNEVLSTGRVLSVTCIACTSSLDSEKARKRKCLQMALPFSNNSSRRLGRVERGKQAHFGKSLSVPEGGHFLLLKPAFLW